MSFGELQKDILAQIERDMQRFGDVAESRRTINHLKSRLSMLEDNFLTARRYHEEIMSRSKLEKGTLKEELVGVYRQIHEVYLDYRSDLLDAIDKCTPATKPSSESHNSSSVGHPGSSIDLRLPSIQIPTFSGSYTKWRSYHDVFVSLVHTNESLSDIQKMHHLKASLAGDAERLLQHVSLEAENYIKAWDLLKARYDHKRILVNAQLKLLFSQASLVKETAEGIQSILDTSQDCIHSLHNLGLPVQHWDAILIFVLFQKLPCSTQQLWEEKLGSSTNVPTMGQFTEFLETRFRTLEAVQLQPAITNFKATSKTNPQTKTFHTKTQKSHSVERFQCKVCHLGQHSLRKCRKFLSCDLAAKLQIVRQVKVCENCLAYSHPTRECPSSRNCYFCHRRHHSLLHPTTNVHMEQTTQQHTNISHNTEQQVPQFNENSQGQGQVINPNAPAYHPMGEQPSTSQSRRNFYAAHHESTQVLLATAIVKARSADGNYIELRALIDPGSEATFISESAAQRLKLPKHRTLVEVSGLGKVSSGACKHYVDIMFTSRHSTFESATKAFIFKSLTGLLPAQRTTLDTLGHIQGLQLADPAFNIPAPIDLLLGSDVYSEIILPEIVRSEKINAPIAQKTQLGWIVLGKIPDGGQRRLQSFFQLVDLDMEMRRFWEIEEAPFKMQPSEEDVACENHFISNTKRLPNGRYEVALPFKEGRYPALGDSRGLAYRRFIQLERRFERDEKLSAEYSKCIQEYLTLGHMEEIDLEKDATIFSPYHFFLPHHAVFKEASSTTKLRVVFDAAAKTTDGTSLNEHLLVGPKLQKNIFDVILRWRMHRYTFTADIEKMYRQVSVLPADRYYQTIFWRENTTQPLRAFRLKTVTFGTACAPYLAIRVLHKVAEDEAHNYPIGARVVQEDMYVDDLISGANTIEEALQKRNEVRQLLASAGLNLRKWTSNDKVLLEDINENDCEIGFELPFGSLDHVRTLGIRWNPMEDSFFFQNLQPINEEVTKRTMLSAIAKLFDPLGWISPCVIKAKIMMQQLWLRGAEWDKPIPNELKNEWDAFRRDLPLIQNIRIPRWVSSHNTCKDVELHGFSDASTMAYGAAVYLRVLDSQDTIHMHLLMSKTKVAPLKTISLPRLELCGALVLASLMNYTVETLGLPAAKLCAWSDSTIALAWIRATPSRWTTFVSNRVSEIQRLTNANTWKHVPTDQNPADLASRGISPSVLEAQDLWWKGPTFLRDQWHFQLPDQPALVETEEEKRRIKTHCVITNTSKDDDVSIVIHRFSKLLKVIRILAYCLRLWKNCISPVNSRTLGILEPEELYAATQVAIKSAQKEMFPAELTELKEKFTTPKNLKSLNAFIDAHGIIRVGGRIQNSLLAYNQQHPIILRHNHHFTTLLIRYAHDQTNHGGIQQMVAYIRTSYWIFNIKRSVKKHIHHCVKCFRQKAQNMQQLMGSLPAPRVRMARPFSNTGVDYAGPIDVKTWKGRGAKTFKGYFAVFICLATKAIHLEAVSDMTTQAFIAAFKRFTARRGLCSQIYSDCGTNFVGANAELHRMLRDAKHDWQEVAYTLANQGTKWNFIPPASPHFGGLWEAGVKSVKHHLKRVIRDERLTFEELCTLLTQIEACLNSRPLCPLSDNPDDLDVITPGHFLIGEPLQMIPQGDTSCSNVSYLERWKRIQVFVNAFWTKWSGEYLSRLQQRPKWTKIESEPTKGDLVLVKDERIPPSQWILARITETHPGADQLVRVVTLKTKTGIIKRPITKICYLPTNETTEDNTII